MGYRRWILSSSPINGRDCFPDCYVPNLPTPLDSSPGNRRLVNAVLAAVSVAVLVAFIVLAYYAIFVRRRRTDHLPSGDHSPPAPNEDYHEWRVRTVGLNESSINSIAVNPYISGCHTAADCSVCLVEFRDGELVRLLTGCGHAFHVTCIDTWLRAHISCPLCRANIVINPADPGDGISASIAPDGNSPINERMVSVDSQEEAGREMGAVRDRCQYFSDCGESSSSSFAGSGLMPELLSKSMDSLPENDIVMSLTGGDENRVNEKTGRRYRSFTEDCRQKGSAEINGGGGSSTSASGKMLFSLYGRARSCSVLAM